MNSKIKKEYEAKKIKKVFLDDLPRKGKFIDWKNSIGYKVKFIYNNVEGKVKIVDYDVNSQYMHIKYSHYENFRIHRGNFIGCKFGKILGKITSDFKIKIGQNFKDYKRDIVITDKKYVKKLRKDGKTENEKFYKYKCNKCGFKCGSHYLLKEEKIKKDLWIKEGNLLNGDGCPCCSSSPKIVVEGINDIPTTAPWMVEYFQGGYDEAKKYTKYTDRRIKPICPDCGRIKSKPTIIGSIYRYHSINCNCSDSVSYPNKFCFSLLKQLNISFESEYSPRWCNYELNKKNKTGRYDFYFQIKTNKYIIEMDGGFHKSNNKMTGQTAEESKKIDNYKDLKAKENDIEVIRIDCEKSELEYIKQNILNSKLNILFNLELVDWFKCEEFALSNLIKKACEIKRNNPNITTREIAKIMDMTQGTIVIYLKKGHKLGWCQYDPKMEVERSVFKKGNTPHNKKRVEIFKNGISLGRFESVTDLVDKIERKLGVKLTISHISLVCRGKEKQHKGYTFKYIGK